MLSYRCVAAHERKSISIMGQGIELLNFLEIDGDTLYFIQSNGFYIKGKIISLYSIQSNDPFPSSIVLNWLFYCTECSLML